MIKLRSGDPRGAEDLLKRVLAVEPRHAGALNVASILMMRLARLTEAEDYARRALQENPASDATLYNYGLILKALKRPREALDRFSQALALNPSVAETWNNRGTTYNDLREYQAALADFDKAIAINPNYPDAFCNKAKSLAELNAFEGSLAAYDEALRLKPDLAEAWLGRSKILLELQRHDDATQSYQRALNLRPQFAEAWLGLATIAARRRQPQEALAAYERALALKPDLAEAWADRGSLLTDLERGDAVACFDKALAIRPELNFAEGGRLFAKRLVCDWSNFEPERAHLIAGVRAGRKAARAFQLLALTSSAADQLQCARLAAADTVGAPLPAPQVHERIRIAYLSADLREHAVSYLMAGVFEQHDRARFETFAVSFGPGEASAMRARLKTAFDHFLDVDAKSDADVTGMLREYGIDIAVDLTGPTSGARPAILAARAAPVQVNYLGYPGTSGAPYIDYIIADHFIVPGHIQPHYSEKVVCLPDCFQANDSKRPRPPPQRSRVEAGLPSDSFVFCSFNSAAKITPDVFDVWMRLLRAVDGSVLWLLAPNVEAERNLRREAAARGVAAQRIVLAPRAGYQDYLAQYPLADVFLDSFPFNAGTTASDALWMGLPLVTCAGEAFASRMAGSLLQALGLTELITTSLQDYEVLALQLARDPARLASIKQTLASHRDTAALFDTGRFTRHLEAAFRTMCDRHRRGLPPASFAVG